MRVFVCVICGVYMCVFFVCFVCGCRFDCVMFFICVSVFVSFLCGVRDMCWVCCVSVDCVCLYD